MEIIHKNYHEIFPGGTTVRVDMIDESPRNPRHIFTEEHVKNLAASIGKNGLLQPITVRSKNVAGRFEIVTGHRRYRAFSFLVDNYEYNPFIPVHIRQMTDQEAADAQMTENLAREDLTPLEEAQSYQSYIKEFGIKSIKTLSQTFGKSATHIRRTLQLLHLTEDLKKLLNNGTLPLPYALELCRIKREDQTKAWEYLIGAGGLKTLTELKNFIEVHIMVMLDHAVFDVFDAKLFEEAGACLGCSKATNEKGLLFGDMAAKQARCLDRTCYSTKIRLHIVQQLDIIAKSDPDTIILWDIYYPIEKAFQQVMDHLKLSASSLSGYHIIGDDVEQTGFMQKAFIVSGQYSGTYVLVRRSSGNKRAEAVAHANITQSLGLEVVPEVESIDDQIKTAQDWRQRVQELYEEKVYADVKKAFYAEENRALIGKMNATEEICLFLFLWDSISQEQRDQCKDRMPSYFDDSTPERLFKSLKRLATGTIGLLLRVAFEEKFGSRQPHENGGYFLNLLMRSHMSDFTIQTIEEPHKAELAKRIETADNRIDSLMRKKSKSDT